MTKIIRGSGGKDGGSSGRVAVEAADSLQSKAFASVMDLVSEGEIVGLVDGKKSIFVDGTPLQNPDGTDNFTGIEYDFRNGTQDQSYIQGFPASESELPVGVEIKAGIPVVRTITNQEVTATRVRVSFPQMTSQNTSTGDISGTSVEIAIDLQSDGGGWVEQLTDRINGKSTSKYEKTYRITLTGPPPWDIRVRRITPDSTTIALQNRTFLESYAEIIDGKFKYPNSAIIAVKIDSAQFSRIPVRGYDIKGLKVRVPSNYDAETRTYSGVWDGNFNIAWTDNPAWIFYDLLTSERYGLGSFLPESQVDKWSLYQIGRYCDELVPDGFGGTEPRFTCNLYIQSRNDAFRVIQDLASCFRGMTYWSNGTLTTVQDAPLDPTYLFTAANVVDGIFEYSGTSAKVRHTVCLVTWNDPDNFYKQKIEYVEDTEAIARYGVVETSIVAIGCTSRGQANRAGKWLLYSERYQTETVSFRAGLEGAICRPGEIIKVADPARAGSRRAGRISSATTTQLVIDDNLIIDPSSHTVSVVLPDGSIEERQIFSCANRIIEVSVPFSVAPQSQAIWMVTSSVIEPQLFKVIGISEADDGTFTISAVNHDPQKFDYVEQGMELEPRSISSLSTVPNAPIGLQITETLYAVNGEVRVKVTISWNKVPFAASYIVQWRRDDGNINEIPETSTNEIEILNAEPGEYTATVYAFSTTGVRSPGATVSRRVLGKASPPNSVQGFSLVPTAGIAYLSWLQSTDLDVLIGGTVRVRHSTNIDDPVWKNSVDIVPALPGNATRAQVPLLPGAYMAKFVDSSGIASIDEAIIITTVPEALTLNVVETITESPTFPGNKTGMAYFSQYDGIAISALEDIDDIESIDDVLSWDFAGGVAPLGSYEFENVFDLGDIYTSRLTATITAASVDVTDSIDQRFQSVDDWIDLDGNLIDDVNAELFVSTTNDDPTSMGAVWTPYKRFFVADVKARAMKFKLVATSESDYHNIYITDLSVVVDMPDRVINLSLTSSTSVLSVSYDKPFKETPSLGITAYNMNSGDYSTITNEDETGFDIIFKNSAGTPVVRKFDVMAKGYGRKTS